MTTLTRRATIGAHGRFHTLADAEAHYAQFNMRLVTHDAGCAEFSARVTETRAETRDGRTFDEVYTSNMKSAAKVAASKRGGEAKQRSRTRATHCKHPGCDLPRETDRNHALCVYHRKQHDAARSRVRYAKKKAEVTA